MTLPEHRFSAHVAVVIPTFNRRTFALEAVRSVLTQTFQDLMCIVVNDGSTDGTSEALASISDPRLRVLTNQAPLGGSTARNLGVTAAEGARWIAFLDSDDLWAPTKLEAQFASLRAARGARWSTTACAKVSGDLQVQGALRMACPRATSTRQPYCATVVSPPQLEELFLLDNAVPAGNSTVMVERDLFLGQGGYNTGLQTCEDYDLWLRLARVAPLSYVDLPLAAYRIWDGQASNHHRAFVRDAATVRASHFPQAGPLPRSYKVGWQLEAARRNAASGRRVRAAGHYAHAAWLGRAPAQLAYALAAALQPSFVERRLLRRDLAHMPAGWDNQIADWLTPYQRAPISHDVQGCPSQFRLG